MKRKLAELISFVGNPLILAVVVGVYVNFTTFPLRQALKLTAILGFGIIVPIFLYIHQQVRKGKYDDHDVSDRQQRKGVYMVALILLLGVIAVLHLTNQPKRILTGAYAAWTLGAVSFVVNHFFLKTSLHTGYAFLIGFLALSVSTNLGIALIGFALLVGWSRIILARHSWQEVAVGAVLGSVIGYGFL